MISQYSNSRNGRTKKMNDQVPTHVCRVPNRLQAAWIGFQFKSRGITQDEIAKRVGVSSKTVNHVIHGIRTSGKVQKAIAETLGFSSWDALLASRPEVAA